MSKRARAAPRTTVAHVCAALESIAPTGLAQDWDNVGLIAGDPSATVRRVLVCIDLTTAVVEEAVRERADLVVAYHPPIFKPISSLRADSRGAETAVFQCVRNGIAVYAVHTALDAADGGTNDVLASLCGLEHTEPIEYVDQPSVSECKLVVFVPKDALDKVAEAVFAAGAGHIGDYSRCSYRLAGQGTFYGGESTSPAIGERGRVEHVDEVRLETVVPSNILPAVVTAMVQAHPYEEPAYDVYPLRPRPVRGIGRVGKLPRSTTLRGLARRLKRTVEAHCVQIIGSPEQAIDRAVIVAGAAGDIPFRVPLASGDVIITGEIRHHDALTIRRIGCTAIALGHWTSERPVLASLSERLQTTVPALTAKVSTADEEPFQTV